MRPWFTRTLACALICLTGLMPTAPAGAAGFRDLEGHWGAAVILRMGEAGVIKGYPDGTFRPDAPVTRAEFVVLVIEALQVDVGSGGAVPFRDEDRIPDWARPAVAAAYRAGIVKGDGDSGGFVPERPVSRTELAVVLDRAAAGGIPEVPTGKGAGALPFVDAAGIPDWAQPAVARAVSAGLLAGRGAAVFAPDAPTTRAEAAAAVERLLALKSRDRGEPGAVSKSPAVGSGKVQATGSPATVPARDGILTLGYYLDSHPGKALHSVATRGPLLSAAVHFAFAVDGRGRVTGQVNQDLMRAADRSGTAVLAVLHNDTPAGFSRGVASSLLRNPEHRSRAVTEVTSLVRSHGYAGVNLDLENVDPVERPHYTAFVAELATALRPHGKLVTVAVPAKVSDDPYHNWSGAFDYAALGRHADLVVIMAYDEHWAGGRPGPVASMPWVRRVMEYAVARIPREKVVLGLAAYGYDWPAAGGTAAAFAAHQALARAAGAGAVVGWDDTAQVPYYTYGAGSGRRVVYFENRYSAAFKLNLVRDLGLAGVAVWRLGLEEDRLWTLLDSHGAGRPLH